VPPAGTPQTGQAHGTSNKVQSAQTRAQECRAKFEEALEALRQRGRGALAHAAAAKQRGQRHGN